jgi:Uma2 family endonuclease
MSDAGLFEDRHVELINGDLYELVVKPPHDTSVALVVEALRASFGAGYVIRDQKALDLGRRNQLIPDVAVVRGQIRDYAAVAPRTALLIVEVSDSTLRKDRTIKAHRYARIGILDYWIVNLVDRQLEIHHDPGPDPAHRRRFRYADVTIVPANGHATALAMPQAQIAVADLLP